MQAEIKGTTMPILIVTLDQGEAVVSAHGELAWMTQSIQMSQMMNAGGGGLMQGLKRVLGRGGMWGGDGFLLQKLEGQGTAWIELSGELTTYDLLPGQTLLVHPGHVGMFQGSVQFAVTRMPGIANASFGGDGFHLVALTGPGRVWLQSMPLAVLAQAISQYLPQGGRPADAAGAGAVGGILGDMFRG
jgi:uncharacterized protein (AIM24 family)